jgi:hypothetical protein
MGIVWIASYPKSGNTWLRLALQAFRRGGAVDINDNEERSTIASSRASFDELLDVESSDLTEDEVAAARPLAYRAIVRRHVKPVLLKVHDAWSRIPSGAWLFPPDATAGAIYLIRDPRDVAISFAHHLGVSVDTAITRMASPNTQLAALKGGHRTQFPQRLSSWSGHVESWLNAPGIRVLLVRYEDMTADMPRVLTDVIRFIGWSADRETVTRAAHAVRFSALREQEEAHGFRERLRGMDRFFRRGVAGGWRNDLTAEQVERILAGHASIMRRFGYLDPAASPWLSRSSAVD